MCSAQAASSPFQPREQQAGQPQRRTGPLDHLHTKKPWRLLGAAESRVVLLLQWHPGPAHVAPLRTFLPHLEATRVLAVGAHSLLRPGQGKQTLSQCRVTGAETCDAARVKSYPRYLKT